MSEQVFLVAMAMVATTLILTVKMIAGALGARSARSEMGQIKDQLDQHAAAIEDAQQGAASQATQLAELQERLDFAERLLAQTRERVALKPGEQDK